MSAALLLRRAARRPSLIAALVLGVSVGSHACGGAGAGQGAQSPGGAGPGGAVAGQACVDQLPLEDCVDYALEREAVVEMLEEMEAARDQRSVPVAEEALSSGDPVVVAAGLRLIGPFVDKDERAAALVAPHITSPYLTTSDLAAAALSRTQKYGTLGSQYRQGHGDLTELDPWAKAAPVALGAMGFPQRYPSATAYPPGDSPTSAGFASNDPVDAVLAHYRGALSLEPIAVTELETRLQAQSTQGFEAVGKQMQALQEEYSRTQDPKLLERMQQLGQSLSTKAELSMSTAVLPLGESRADARAFVVEQLGEAPVRVVVVYREVLLARSVVLYLWSAAKYPPIPQLRKSPRQVSF